MRRMRNRLPVTSNILKMSIINIQKREKALTKPYQELLERIPICQTLSDKLYLPDKEELKRIINNQLEISNV